MKTFWQFIEVAKHIPFEDEENQEVNRLTIENILEKFDHKKCVEFALFCVKEVIHLTKDPSSYRHIEVVEQWIDGDNSVTQEELPDNSGGVSGSLLPSLPDYYASRSAYSTYLAVFDASRSAHYASYAASYACLAKGNYEQDIKRYALIAKAWKNYKSPFSKETSHFVRNRNITKEDIMALLDRLQELDDQAIAQTKRGVTLELPHYHVFGKTMEDLVNNIMKDKIALSYVRSMFQ